LSDIATVPDQAVLHYPGLPKMDNARKLPWLYCIDNILNTMSTRISTLRDMSRDKVGVVPEVVGILQNWWNDREKHQIIQ
jgi:hypothetical protein